MAANDRRIEDYCYYSGTAPFCKGSCSKGDIKKRVGDPTGNRCITGQKVCCAVGKYYKSYPTACDAYCQVI